MEKRQARSFNFLVPGVGLEEFSTPAVYECRWAHLLYKLYMYSSSHQTSKYNCSAFRIGVSTTCPAWNYCETIVHGPKASTPTLVKGGDGSTRSVGRSAIICCSVFPLSLRQVMHLWIMDDTKRFDPIIQNPAALTTPSVIWRPWWW
jgi:hypothetical protein